MQYSVPQFVEVEDRIVGPLTLKQFLIVLAGGILLFALWKIFGGLGIGLVLFGLPIVGLTALLGFGKFNGRPILASFPLFVRFYLTPRYRVFRRIGESAPLIKQTPSRPVQSRRQQSAGTEAPQSRLKRLAYLLDQKTAEEERLIHSGARREQWINQI